MEKLIPLKTNSTRKQPCDKTDCVHCINHSDAGKDSGADSTDKVAANIFRKYYEALLQGYSIDFFKGNHAHGNFHCT